MKNPLIAKNEEVSPAFALLLILITLTILANFIPSGVYERFVENGKTVVDPSTFNYIEKKYADFGLFFQSFYQGFVRGAGLNALVIFIGAAFFGVAKDIGILEMALTAIYTKIKNLPFAMFVFLIMFFYGIIISFTGMFDLGSVFIPLIIPLCLALGYDAMTGCAIILGSAAIGYGSAMANPFFTANAHLIAELPIYSAAWYRGIGSVIMLIPTTWFIVRYANKVKKNPELSLTHDLGLDYKALNEDQKVSYTPAHIRASIAFFGLFAFLLYGTMVMDFGYAHISGTFIAMAIVTGLAYGMTLDQIATSMTRGMSKLFIVIVVMTLAQATVFILDYTKTIDTIIKFLAQFVSGNPYQSTSILFFVQTLINFIVPSGAGQALITMPVVVPLADIGGVGRQIACLASQYGDGFSNFIWPTNGSLLAILAISGIPYTRWFKFFWPLFAILVSMCLISLWIAIYINLQ